MTSRENRKRRVIISFFTWSSIYCDGWKGVTTPSPSPHQHSNGVCVVFVRNRNPNNILFFTVILPPYLPLSHSPATSASKTFLMVSVSQSRDHFSLDVFSAVWTFRSKLSLIIGRAIIIAVFAKESTLCERIFTSWNNNNHKNNHYNKQTNERRSWIKKNFFHFYFCFTFAFKTTYVKIFVLNF